MFVPGSEDWYTRRDARRTLTPHCPLASNDKCPRYYLSLKHADTARALTQCLSDENRALIEKKWESSDVFATIEESVATWYENDGSLRGFDGFCPEVAAKLFGHYCCNLRNYPDEHSKIEIHRQLKAGNIPKDDTRWEWMTFVPRHYTDCIEYSLYSDSTIPQKRRSSSGNRAISPKTRWTVFCRDDIRCIYCNRKPPEVTLHVDHKISVAAGGSDELDNLVTACEECNLGKGARSAA